MADQQPPPEPLGLIAGQGRFPFLVADGARHAGRRVVCVGLRGQADPALKQHVDKFYWAGIARPGRWIRKLRAQHATETILIGRVAKKRIYTPWRILQYLPDWRAFRIWYHRMRHKDRRNDTLLNALADELAAGGIHLQDSTKYCQDHLAAAGLMTRTKPPQHCLDDIEWAWPLVKELGRHDIGQAIAVKEREIIAIEAIEGTNRMIQRAGELCRAGGWTLIKTAKPNQDKRFDVPTIGPDTIKNLKENGAACLALEANSVLIADKPKTLQLADQLKIAILGHNP